jgi:CubicO group peptidase (beta-lactamase class C family)
MASWQKRAVIGAGGLVAFLAVVWVAIGPDWRSLLSNPPSGTDVLFWSQEQRDTGFRMFDKVPFLIEARDIDAGGTTKELPVGNPLDIDAALDAYFDEGRGVAVVVLHEGKLRAERYGLGFEKDERWTSFSVAKSITSTLVGAAMQDGYIESLDAPVTDYIEDLKNSAYDAVTIRQLLTMTSGVGWNEDYEDPNSDVAQFGNHVAEGDEPNIVSYMRTLDRAHEPGTQWNYSTGETNLIGILVSEATGKTVADYLTEKIWQPYGMDSKATWLIDEDQVEISGCCIQATTRDFARFGQFILDGGRINGAPILPDGWLDEATTKQADIGFDPWGYGYQWWTYDDGAFGAQGIFGQAIFIDPARDLVIAINSSWSSALGTRGGEREAREAFQGAVQAAIDAEATG